MRQVTFLAAFVVAILAGCGNGTFTAGGESVDAEAVDSMSQPLVRDAPGQPGFAVLSEQERSKLTSHPWDAGVLDSGPMSTEVWHEDALLGFLPARDFRRDGFLQVLYDDALLGDDAAVTGFYWTKGEPFPFEEAPLRAKDGETLQDFTERLEQHLEAEWQAEQSRARTPECRAAEIAVSDILDSILRTGDPAARTIEALTAPVAQERLTDIAPLEELEQCPGIGSTLEMVRRLQGK